MPSRHERITEQRQGKLDRIRVLGIDPYPARCRRTHTTREAVALLEQKEAGQAFQDEVSIAGRIMAKRKMGRSAFFDIHDDSGKMQLLFRNIDRFDGRCGIMTWVHRIALNEALQFLRRKKRLPRAMPEIAREIAGEPGTTAVDARMDIEQALDRLSEHDRSLIVLRHMHGLTYAEIEEVLEKPPGTIASGLNRARQALRELLDEPGVKERDPPGRPGPLALG